MFAGKMWSLISGTALLGVVVAFITPAAHSFRASFMSDSSAASPEFYTTRVQPILQANCYRCHAGLNHRGGLSMSTQASLMHGGKDGVVIVPGHPEQSLLIKLIRHDGPPNDPMPMPPKGKLSDADIAVITAWVQAGAPMPAATATH